MMRAIREATAIFLVALLPFHAFLVTAGTKAIAGPGHAPLGALAAWKEALVLLLVILCCIECVIVMREPHVRRTVMAIDAIDAFILLFVALACAVSFFVGQNLAAIAYGLKYDVLPLAVLFLARRVEWSDRFVRLIKVVIVAAGGAVAFLGLLSFVLPASVFAFLGYSDLHSIYVANKPLAAFQHIGEHGARRMQSVMSGPNQLGIWLLVPLSLLGTLLHDSFLRGERSLLRSFTHLRDADRVFLRQTAMFLLCTSALFFSFSRSAWIATAVMAVTVAYRRMQSRLFRLFAIRFAALCVCGALVAGLLAPQIMVRISSLRGHVVRPLQAIAHIIDRPLGAGLGSAGPASHRQSDTCVHLRPQDDPSWAQDRPDLCVFLGTQQVQPIDRLCICPLLPENWYLQIGIETGVIGFVLYVMLIALLIMKLWKAASDDALAEVALLSFIGVSVAALALHAWEDAAVAYTVWLLAGITLARLRRIPD